MPDALAVDAVRQKLDEFFRLVDIPDDEFDKLDYKIRMQPPAAYFAILAEQYTPRANTARTIFALRKCFRQTWISRKAINVPRELLRGYVICMHCYRASAQLGILSTVASALDAHLKSSGHVKNAGVVAAGAAGPFAKPSAVPAESVLDTMTGAQLFSFFASGTTASEQAKSTEDRVLRQADLGECGVEASHSGVRKDDNLRALIAGHCTSLGLPPYTAADIFSKEFLSVSDQVGWVQRVSPPRCNLPFSVTS